MMKMMAMFVGILPTAVGLADGASVAIDATLMGSVLPNSSQVLTFWNGVMTGDRSPVAWPKEPRQDYPIGFARYAELMASTGGNKSRDLFKNPDDRNNWFVDWERDRVARGITPKDTDWSWDDFAVLSGKGLRDEKLRATFAKELQPRYVAKAASVRPTESMQTVSADATLTLPVSFVGNGVAFLTVERKIK